MKFSVNFHQIKKFSFIFDRPKCFRPHQKTLFYLLSISEMKNNFLTNECNTSQQMCPYIRGFSMYPEDAPETGAETGQWWPMTMGEEIIILQPNWKMLEMTHGPTDLYQLSNYMFRLTGRVLGQRRNIQFVAQTDTQWKL